MPRQHKYKLCCEKYKFTYISENKVRICGVVKVLVTKVMKRGQKGCIDLGDPKWTITEAGDRRIALQGL